jgi:hypothetical protein
MVTCRPGPLSLSTRDAPCRSAILPAARGKTGLTIGVGSPAALPRQRNGALILFRLAAGARDDLAERLKGGAIKFLKLHLLDRSEIVRAGGDSDAG